MSLYLAGDVMLVTPLRDGMNLVAKEYVAARRDVNGVLVLSEFAGAADQLTDAVLVNPHDDEALREAIVTAVEMHHGERTARHASAARQRGAQRRAGVGRALPRRAGGAAAMTVMAFPGHAGRCWPLTRWRSLARIRETVHP